MSIISNRQGSRQITNRYDDETEVNFFYVLDKPIYDTQTELLMADLEEDSKSIHAAGTRKKAWRIRKLWWDHLLSIDHDSYGSFVLEFDNEIMSLTDLQLEQCNDDIHTAISNSKFMEAMCVWMGIEEDTDDMVESWGAEDAMNTYIDAVLDCGYKMEQSDIETIFENHLTQQTIAQECLLRSLKGQKIELKQPEIVA